MKLFKLRIYISIFIVSAVAFSCNEENVQSDRVLISYENILFRSASELKTLLNAGNIKLDLSQLKYDVDIYSITYKTTYKGKEITASALVSLPEKADAVGMISFHHGTIAAHSQAPTSLPLSSGELILYSSLASPGFIAVVPDLIGFGSSKDLLHPYYVKDATASAIIDALKAAADLAKEKNVQFNKKLFLAGYSQGGYATMAAHRAIEKDGLPNFDLIASFPSSGGYDVKNMQEYFFTLTNYDQPFYLAYVARAYQNEYHWTQPLTDIFKEPYASRIPELLNGTLTSGDINAQLTTSIKDLVNDDLRTHIDTDAKYKYIVDAFKENSLTDWTPTKKMFMYHGDADTTVPYSNSVVTYNKLIANGASANNVTLTALPGKDHGTGVIPYIEKFIPKLLELK
jgi:pimeloyl-ACP methyl ester carboxylesterase